MRRFCLALSLLVLTAPVALAANVRKVEVLGLDRVPVEDVMQMVPFRVGDVFDPRQVAAAKAAIERLGTFIEVREEVREQGQVVDVVFRVVENPLVRGVFIEGNTQVASAALRPELATRPHEILDRVAIARDAQHINERYRRLGLYVVVDVHFEPQPLASEPPVLVTFRIRELKARDMTATPLNYVKADALGGLTLLQPGEMVTAERLGEQQVALLRTRLFAEVGDPVPSDIDAEGLATIEFPVVEADHPVLTAETLPLVDLDTLRRRVRFDAVDLSVNNRDLDLLPPAAETAQRLQAAQAAVAAAPQDVAARAALMRWTERAGQPLRPVAEQALPVLEAVQGPAAQLALGQAYLALGRHDDAVAAYEQALAGEPSVAIAAAAELLIQYSRDPQAIERIQQTVLRGVEAALALPQNADIETLTRAYQFYYTALGLSQMNIGMKSSLRLDSPLGRHLTGIIYQLGRRESTTPAELRHLGKLFTSIGFVARTLADTAVGSEAALQQYIELLQVARQMLAVDLDTADDPMAPFWLGLNDLVRGDLASLRQVVLDGLRRNPDDLRLVDLYIVGLLPTPLTRLEPDKSADLLRASIQDVQQALANGGLTGWGPLMLLAKLHLAYRETLPETNAGGREQARQALEAAAASAAQADPQRRAGWWLLGMARLKGPQPATALEPYQKALELAPHDPEAHFAVALAQLLAGQTAEGLATMADLLPATEHPAAGPLGPAAN